MPQPRPPFAVVVRAMTWEPLSVPLLEPFVIASARVDGTRAALVSATVLESSGARRGTGLGEAATLVPVTREDQPEVLRVLAAAVPLLEGATLASFAELTTLLDGAFKTSPVARAAAECAILDGWARAANVGFARFLGGSGASLARELVTDITLPIAPLARMVANAVAYRALGFTAFKIKVGKHVDDDVRALLGIHAAVPDATFRIDANEGFSADTALALLGAARDAGAVVECFEQPCARGDLDGMARVTAEGGVCVVADESVRTLAELEAVAAARAASGVNLKLVKSGGPLAAFAIGARAKALGMRVMVGGMVETRLGMGAMAHVASALGGVDFVDLDTAFLLADDPFDGIYSSDGPRLTLATGHGLDVRVRSRELAKDG